MSETMRRNNGAETETLSPIDLVSGLIQGITPRQVEFPRQIQTSYKVPLKESTSEGLAVTNTFDPDMFLAVLKDGKQANVHITTTQKRGLWKALTRSENDADRSVHITITNGDRVTLGSLFVPEVATPTYPATFGIGEGFTPGATEDPTPLQPEHALALLQAICDRKVDQEQVAA